MSAAIFILQSRGGRGYEYDVQRRVARTYQECVNGAGIPGEALNGYPGPHAGCRKRDAAPLGRYVRDGDWRTMVDLYRIVAVDVCVGEGDEDLNEKLGRQPVDGLPLAVQLPLLRLELPPFRRD